MEVGGSGGNGWRLPAAAARRPPAKRDCGAVGGAEVVGVSQSAGSWQSNCPNPPNADSGAEPADSEGLGDTDGDDLPTPGERVQEFVREYPGRAFAPLSETDGRKIRRELTEAERVEYDVELKYGEGTVERSYETERRALPWVAAVEGLLESYEADRDASLRFGRGCPESPDREEFTVPLENSWMPSAQERAFAQLKALDRETVGFYTCDESGCGYYCDDPDEHGAEWVPGEYADPCVGLITLSASATPDGDHLPPVDHTDARRETWGGRDGVRRKLRDVLSRKMGLESSDWTYWRQTEPHAGGGDNSCYGHDHLMVVFDRAAADGDLPLETAEDLLRLPVERHVERCEYAGSSAHADEAVEVKSIEGDGDGEVGHLANYMADYISVDPDEGLLERPIEFIAWAAQMWAANRNKRSRAVSAGAAIDADACKQQYRDPESEQDHDHGERLRHNGGRGPEIECAECGSSWGVSQGETVIEARRGSAGDDGGSASGEPSDPDPEAELRDRWPSANAAGMVTHDGEAGGFSNPPEWEAEALIRGSGEDAEEHPVGGGGVDMVPLNLPTEGGNALWDPPDGVKLRCSECGFATYAPETMQKHAATHGEDPAGLVKHEQV